MNKIIANLRLQALLSLRADTGSFEIPLLKNKLTLLGKSSDELLRQKSRATTPFFFTKISENPFKNCRWDHRNKGWLRRLLMESIIGGIDLLIGQSVVILGARGLDGKKFFITA